MKVRNIKCPLCLRRLGMFHLCPPKTELERVTQHVQRREYIRDWVTRKSETKR